MYCGIQPSEINKMPAIEVDEFVEFFELIEESRLNKLANAIGKIFGGK